MIARHAVFLQHKSRYLEVNCKAHNNNNPMHKKIHSLLFPATYREFFCQRLLLNLLRGVHLLFIAVLVGGIYFNLSAELLKTWILGVLLSGIAMFLIELYSSCIYLFEIRGAVIVFKMLVLLSLFIIPSGYHFYVLVGLLLFSSFVSHSPRRIRHANFMPEEFQQKYGFTSDRSSRL